MEDNQFRMTLVTRVRRGQPDAPEAAPNAEAVPPAAQRADSEAQVHHSHHHRHYEDYGTFSLGQLGQTAPPRTADAPASAAPTAPAAPAAPSQGALQREFFDKYDSVLSRRYATRNRGKTARIALIALLGALVLLLSAIGLSSLGDSSGGPLKKPQVETVPVVTLDLG